MFTERPLFTTIIVFLVFAFVYLVHDDFTVDQTNMSSTQDPSIPVEVTIASEPVPNNFLGSAVLRFTLTNTSPNDIYIIRWGTPFDNASPRLGMVTFTSTSTGEAAPCLNMKINHRIPESGWFPPDDHDIVHIPPYGNEYCVVTFKEPSVALVVGEEYRAQAHGCWMGVWVRESGASADRLSLDDGMIIGEFESNEIVITIPAEVVTEKQ